MDGERKNVDARKRNIKNEDNNDEDRANNGLLLPQNNDGNRIEQLMHQVFENDVLRERILTHVIQNDESCHDICSIRLVQKAWMKDVTRIMKKIRKPLYHLELDEDNSINSSDYVRNNGMKVLDHFISTVVPSPTRIENVIPPFSLSIDLDFFQDENRQSFSDFLTGGSIAGLVELEMSIPKNGGSMDLIFGDKSLFFPALRKLSVEFCKEQDDVHLDVVAHGSNSYFLPFLQSVLNGASKLKEMNFEFTSSDDFIPAGIKYLTFPRSLTDLDLQCVLTNTQLEGLALATNALPNLTYLSLPIYNKVQLSSNLIFRILDQYKKTLRTLHFSGIYLGEGDIPKAATHFRFPVMESLQTFSTYSAHAELEPEQHYSLQTMLPVVNSIFLHQQSVNMIRKWTAHSRFATVTKLTVNLVDENISASHDSYEVTIQLEEIQALHLAFPNVSILDLFVIGDETRGLKYLFMEMTQLTRLTIRVKLAHRLDNSYHWDSLLTGTAIHMAKTLAKNSQFWENVNIIDLKVDESSLLNLHALRSLRLIAPIPSLSRQSDVASLISDTAFHLAFLKMPNLKVLELEGKFKVSPEMAQVWEAEHGSISYSPTRAD